MGYKLYCEDNSELVQKDLQDKMEWCRKGERLEDSFIEKYGTELGLIINPENLSKVIRIFSRVYKPYIIGKIISGREKIKLNESISWK